MAIYGRSGHVHDVAAEVGYGSVEFSGGYDDYDGSMAWAVVPVDVVSRNAVLSRFSPSPGVWMDGYRVDARCVPVNAERDAARVALAEANWARFLARQAAASSERVGVKAVCR